MVLNDSLFSQGYQDWLEAVDICEDEGGYLVEIMSQDEQGSQGLTLGVTQKRFKKHIGYGV